MKFDIGEFPGFIAVRGDACQPPQGGDEHSPRHAGVGAELVVSSTGEQPPAGYEDDIILGPMALNVCKGRNRVLVAYVSRFSSTLPAPLAAKILSNMYSTTNFPCL